MSQPIPIPRAYTAMSPAALLAITHAHASSGQAFHLGLNPGDMIMLLRALEITYHSADDDASTWAASLVSGIGEAFGVEVV